jgi:Flp pilus assembly protein TadD
MAALVYLKQGDVARTVAEVEVLRQAYQGRKNDRSLEDHLWETQGMLLCRMGSVDSGLKLLAKAVERTKNDYFHHAWGNGAYFMEVWGTAALQCNRGEVAEEAFLEALAHDPGSVRAALGLQVLCDRLGRTDEAGRFGELAHRCWRRADPQNFAAELSSMREEHSPQRTERTQSEEKTGAGTR